MRTPGGKPNSRGFSLSLASVAVRAPQAQQSSQFPLMQHVDPRPMLRAWKSSISGLLQVLHAWIPADAIDPDLAAQRHSATANSVIYLMEGHDVVQKYMASGAAGPYCPPLCPGTWSP